ncbi:Com family DNA-binding transcriptional regulator [Ralstonia pseudosolanacearum]|uniref:Com family DNA-binding transcriptional regulator n=1 Tax=Ralstonia pseudosolanacearum TaxID=1310165 RepID=UPI002AA54C47|nr:Com family DNA-binding transcriptional regulator [Ralstonia pseudosolanacearum]
MVPALPCCGGGIDNRPAVLCARACGILPFDLRQHRTFMQDIRCGGCSRKLGEGEYTRLVIKCPRCRAINTLRATSPAPERPRASHLQDAHVCQPRHTAPRP